MDIMVFSARDAVQHEIQQDHVWIQITDPKTLFPCVNNQYTRDLIALQFDDITSQASWQDCGYKEYEGRDAVLFDEEMAKKVILFFDKWKNKVEVIAVHCRAGVSRSAGIASFLCQVLGKDSSKFMLPPKYPNPLVRNTLRKVYYDLHGVLIF